MNDSAGNAAAAIFSSLFCGAYCLFMLFYLLVFFLIIGSLALWIWMLVDFSQRSEDEFPEDQDRTVWLLVLLLAGVLGAGVYYFMIYKKFPRVTSGPGGTGSAGVPGGGTGPGPDSAVGPGTDSSAT